jgi:hypothetical protein
MSIIARSPNKRMQLTKRGYL